jgi:protein HIRA/HIR1
MFCECAYVSGRRDSAHLGLSDTKARQAQAVFAPTSLSSLLDPPSSSSMPSRPLEITRVDVRPNGVPIVITSEPSAYAYDPTAHSWAPIITPFLLSGSHSTESRRASQVPPTRGPLAELEAEISSAWKGSEEGDKPEWWDEAMEMGYLENKLRAAVLLESREEYKVTLLRYAHVLGKEGFRARGEELVKDLIGPIYQ